MAKAKNPRDGAGPLKEAEVIGSTTSTWTARARFVCRMGKTKRYVGCGSPRNEGPARLCTLDFVPRRMKLV